MQLYITNSKNQIVGLDISQASGFRSNVINAVKFKIRGIEIGLGLYLSRTKDFEWSFNTNFTQNRGTVKN
jgi:outer membrane receptor for ferrienterochelin and colicin